MPIRHCLMDLDETMYPASSGLWPLIRDRIGEYLNKYAGVAPEKIESERIRYYEKYGTTLRGLAVEKSVDMDRYLEFVHDVPVEEIIHKDPELSAVLKNIHCKKYIFTNASRKHAERVLSALGVRALFSEIFSIENFHPWCKPNREAFTIVLDRMSIHDKTSCVLVDDSPENIRTAKDLGLRTILFSSSRVSDSADHTIQNLDQLVPIFQHEKLKEL